MDQAEKVERVARALCKASGSNPDGLYSTGEMETVRNPGGGHTEQSKKAPLWTKFEDEAHRFVVASEALAGTITSGG